MGLASSPYLEHWQRRIAAQAKRDLQLSIQAKQRLPNLVQLLTQEFAATQIVLFGSLAKDTFRQGSDIDLAVAGIPPAQFFTALSAANRISAPFQIDLKPLEALESHFYDRIVQHGQSLHGPPIR